MFITWRYTLRHPPLLVLTDLPILGDTYTDFSRVNQGASEARDVRMLIGSYDNMRCAWACPFLFLRAA